MTTHQALALAEKCEESAAAWLREIDTRKQAAALLRTHHEALERKDALLRQALDHLINMQPIIANGLLTTRQLQFIDPHIDAAAAAIKEALQ